MKNEPQNNFAGYEIQVVQPKDRYAQRSPKFDKKLDQVYALGRQKHGNFDDYTELTARQSQRGRHSKLGNNVFKVVPRNFLPGMHYKTHFKAVEAINSLAESPEVTDRRL